MSGKNLGDQGFACRRQLNHPGPPVGGVIGPRHQTPRLEPIDGGCHRPAGQLDATAELADRLRALVQQRLENREVRQAHLDGFDAALGVAHQPRPVQNPLPIWLGVGGTPQSFARAGALGLPLMVAIIGGEPRRFRPLVDLYRETGRQHGYSAEQLKVGVHMLGYVADSTQEAADTFYPGYARAMTDVGKERGWPAMTRASFDAQRGRDGALVIGSPDEVVDKILRHSDALGGIARMSFQMNVASLPQVKMMRAIDAIGARVVPALHSGD
jgi:alkanesulfonate monooxygenase SsuD/methylene tetrahydromethanopterin reductase-like flavin-dependent oxidoreductase (luciferase family)